MNGNNFTVFLGNGISRGRLAIERPENAKLQVAILAIDRAARWMVEEMRHAQIRKQRSVESLRLRQPVRTDRCVPDAHRYSTGRGAVASSSKYQFTHSWKYWLPRSLWPNTMFSCAPASRPFCMSSPIR